MKDKVLMVVFVLVLGSVLTTALVGVTGASVLDENTAHLGCSKGEEVGLTLPVHLIYVDQPQVSLMDQSRGLQGVPHFFPAHVITS